MIQNLGALDHPLIRQLSIIVSINHKKCIDTCIDTLQKQENHIIPTKITDTVTALKQNLTGNFIHHLLIKHQIINAKPSN